jgi:hypothetical protein
MDFQKVKPYIGDLSQIFNVKEYRFTGGRSDGVRAVDVENGIGIHMTVLLDRCLDISHLRFGDVNIGYIAPCGIVAPQYFGDREFDFLRSFTVGFLTTGGLSSIGTPCDDNSEHLGLHGRISNTPAENVSVYVEEIDGIPVFKARGTMREARLFGEYLTLTREISCAFGEKKFTITDTVENKSFKTLPHMQLYLCNYGYPMLSENSRLILPSLKVLPRNDHANTGLSRWKEIEPPQDDFEEMCYYHDLACDKNGNTFSGIYNPTVETGIIMHFNKTMLDQFTQWKMMGKGEYVLGLEPGNARMESRIVERECGRLKQIEPGEKKVYHLAVEFIHGKTEFEQIEARLKRLIDEAE